MEIDEDCRVFCSTIGFWGPTDLVFQELTKIAAGKDVSTRLDTILRYLCDRSPRLLCDEMSDAISTLIELGVTRVDNAKGVALRDHVEKAVHAFKSLLHPFAKSSEDVLSGI
jgi:hypothetical protein